MTHILAIDQGTTSSRTIIFRDTGEMVATAQQEFTQIYPRPGLVEHDAVEIWQSQLATIKKAMKQAELSPAEINAIGITNQRETAVVWDRETGEPICNAIVWQDRRTSDHCDRLRADGWAPTIRERTGPGDRRVLLRDEDRVDARARRGRPRARGEGRARLRDDRLVARLEPHGRGEAHHGHLQRLTDDALRHHGDVVGRRVAQTVHDTDRCSRKWSIPRARSRSRPSRSWRA